MIKKITKITLILMIVFSFRCIETFMLPSGNEKRCHGIILMPPQVDCEKSDSESIKKCEDSKSFFFLFLLLQIHECENK